WPSPSGSTTVFSIRLQAAAPVSNMTAHDFRGLKLFYSMRSLIKNVLASTQTREGLTIKGWVRTRRDSKGFSFLEMNDGSCLANLQVVVDAGTPGAENLADFTTGASAVIEGNLVPSPAQGQKWELKAARIELIGAADASYPLQK